VAPKLCCVKGVWLQRILIATVVCAGGAFAAETPPAWSVGVARIDITPSYPIRLAGYASRQRESEGVAQKLYAKAFALSRDGQEPALLVAVDNCGIPASVRQELVRRLARKTRIASERVAICSTHTHSAPLLDGYLPNLFVPPPSAEEQARMQRYTRELSEALEKVALEALEGRRSSTLRFGRGSASFAANRRTKGGPVDHQLPCLFVSNEEGKLCGILTTYACHCTTLTGEHNQVCGDWAGYAQEFLESRFPGAVVLVTIGCGGDANPFPRPGFDLAKKHGREIAEAVEKVLGTELRPVTGKLVCRREEIALPFASLPSRADWEAKASQTDHVGQQARMNLARLDRGEVLPASLSYLVQTWSFGDSLAMVFLPGEVVVDYSLRLRKELDAARLWIHAYANDVPCYIPSERVLHEGGYEGGGAMVYYDKPAPFAPGVEERIIRSVRGLLDTGFQKSAHAE